MARATDPMKQEACDSYEQAQLMADYINKQSGHYAMPAQSAGHAYLLHKTNAQYLYQARRYANDTLKTNGETSA